MTARQNHQLRAGLTMLGALFVFTFALSSCVKEREKVDEDVPSIKGTVQFEDGSVPFTASVLIRGEKIKQRAPVRQGSFKIEQIPPGSYEISALGSSQTVTGTSEIERVEVPEEQVASVEVDIVLRSKRR